MTIKDKNIEEQEEVKIPSECPYCGASRKRPPRPFKDGTCNNNYCHEGNITYLKYYKASHIRRI